MWTVSTLLEIRAAARAPQGLRRRDTVSTLLEILPYYGGRVEVFRVGKLVSTLLEILRVRLNHVLPAAVAQVSTLLEILPTRSARVSGAGLTG